MRSKVFRGCEAPNLENKKAQNSPVDWKTQSASSLREHEQAELRLHDALRRSSTQRCSSGGTAMTRKSIPLLLEVLRSTL